jgi:hypothetical protein
VAKFRTAGLDLEEYQRLWRRCSRCRSPTRPRRRLWRQQKYTAAGAGGLTSRELLNTLRGLVGLNVLGAEIVEVAPAYDHAEITGIAAAHVAYELLSVLAVDKETRSTPTPAQKVEVGALR